MAVLYKIKTVLKSTVSVAGNGVRTRDLLLGKQSLCQLSYTRSTSHCIPAGGESQD